MADNFRGIDVSATPGDTFAADEIGGVKYPRTKVAFGGDGTATDVSASAPLPVTVLTLPDLIVDTMPAVALDSATLAALENTTVTISGTPTVALDSASLAALETINVGNTVSVSGPLTDTQLRASAVPVSGPLTDTQLRASAVPVSGPLTDTQLRATAVPVSLSDPATSKHKLITAASTNSTQIKGSAGKLYKLVFQNLGTAIQYIKLFDASSVTVGTTVPDQTFACYPGQTLDLNFPLGLTFATAIRYAITAAAADNNSGAGAAGNLVNAEYV